MNNFTTLNTKMNHVKDFMFYGGSRDKAANCLDLCRSEFGDDAVAEWLEEWGVVGDRNYVTEDRASFAICRDGEDATEWRNRIEVVLFFD